MHEPLTGPLEKVRFGGVVWVDKLRVPFERFMERILVNTRVTLRVTSKRKSKANRHAVRHASNDRQGDMTFATALFSFGHI